VSPKRRCRAAILAAAIWALMLQEDRAMALRGTSENARLPVEGEFPSLNGVTL
jgi:hypothetical protein